MRTKRQKNTTESDYQSYERDAIEKLRQGKGLIGPDGEWTGLIKRIVEASLDGEMDAHLEQTESANRRNGHTEKQVKTALGTIGIPPPQTVRAVSSRNYCQYGSGR
jgi:transposase-like protein